MKDALYKIINQFTEGVDVYHNNGSMWLIFTDEKKWVIELTKEGVLWYNFYFFQDCFKYLSLDVIEIQHYITEWVEDTIQNGVRYVAAKGTARDLYTEEIIQNGIKETNHCSVSNTARASVNKNCLRYNKKGPTKIPGYRTMLKKENCAPLGLSVAPCKNSRLDIWLPHPLFVFLYHSKKIKKSRL